MSEQPEQVQDIDEAPVKPDPNDAGEGAENSANPIQDEARPDDHVNTTGF